MHRVELTRTGDWNLATRILLGVTPVVGSPAEPARIWVDATVRNATYVYLVNAVVQETSSQQGVPGTVVKTSFAASQPVSP